MHKLQTLFACNCVGGFKVCRPDLSPTKSPLLLVGQCEPAPCVHRVQFKTRPLLLIPSCPPPPPPPLFPVLCCALNRDFFFFLFFGAAARPEWATSAVLLGRSCGAFSPPDLARCNWDLCILLTCVRSRRCMPLSRPSNGCPVCCVAPHAGTNERERERTRGAEER